MPHGLQRRPSAADEAERPRRCAVLLEQLGGRQRVERVQPGVEGTVLVAEAVEIGLVVQRRQIPEGMIGEIPYLSLIEAEAGQHLRIGQHLLGMEPAADPAQHVLAPRIVAVRQVELADVRPVALVARLRELLGPGIRIQPVVEAGAEREHVAACAIGRLEHRHLVPAAHELPRTAQATDSRARDDHALRTRLRPQRNERGGGQLQRLATRESDRLGHVQTSYFSRRSADTSRRRRSRSDYAAAPPTAGKLSSFAGSDSIQARRRAVGQRQRHERRNGDGKSDGNRRQAEHDEGGPCGSFEACGVRDR